MKKNNLLIGLMSLLWIATSQASECSERDIRFLSNKKTIIKKEFICLVDKQTATSKKCQTIINPHCSFSKIKKTKSYESFMDQVSTPGSNLCSHVGGVSQSYEMMVEGSWSLFERCLLKKSGDFVELNELIKYYRTL